MDNYLHDEEALDHFASNILKMRNGYLSAILDAVHIRADFIAAMGKGPRDYASIFAMERMSAELIHRQLYPAWDDPMLNQDEKRIGARYVLQKLIQYVDNQRSQI